MESKDYYVTCTNFQNLDDYDQMLIVMKHAESNDEDLNKHESFLLKFDMYGQANLIATIPC